MNGFFNVSNSPIANAVLKNNRVKALLATALISTTTLATTGVIPVTVAGVESQQVAEACSPWTTTYQAWWGRYQHMNGCAARIKANQLRDAAQSGSMTVVLVIIGAAPHGWIASAITYSHVYGMAAKLDQCADSHNQAYLRLPQTIFQLPSVSCT